MKRNLVVFGIALFMLFGCTLPHSVKYSKIMPPDLEIEGVRKVAVADFDGLHQSGRIIASKVATGIVDTGYYRMFEREKLDEILSEHELYKKDIGIDAATTKQLKLHGVDALIFGVVDDYNIEDQRGTSKVERKVGTGKYRKVEYKDAKTGETKYREEEIIKTVLWDRPYIMRQGSVGVTFRMSNISSGEIVAVEAMTANFSERAWEDEVHLNFQSKDAILDDLASEVVQRFLDKIQPHLVDSFVNLESTGGDHNKLGISYAKNGLWDKALSEFEIAANSEEQNEPSAYYNLAMVYFVLGEHGKAEKLVEQAIAIKPKQQYIQALAKIRNDS